jgi:hypothetical protein
MTSAKRITAVALAAATLSLATGCGSGSGIFGEIHTVSIQVTGTGARASEIAYKLSTKKDTERDTPLPWKKEARSEFVPVSVTATPVEGGTVTCHIVVDGKDVATNTGAPGAAAECHLDKVK